MIALGTTWIGQYRVWVTKSTPGSSEDLYYDVLLVREEDPNFHFYIDLVRDEKFKHLFHLDKRGFPTEQTDMTQYHSYQNRKDMGQPMWKLSTGSLDKLFRQLLCYSKECT